MSPRVLVNAQPLKKSICQGVTDTNSSVDDFIKTSDNTTFGVVIWIRDDKNSKDGKIGEVLAQENFEDVNVHFVFNSLAQIRFKEESDPLGIGSLVHISWAKNITSRMDENHVIVYIEKMFVYKCQMLLKSEIFVVHNSQSMPGISIGMNEQNVEVVFHPSCSSQVRRETCRATRRNCSEFGVRSKFHACQRVKRMVNAWLVVAPFTIDVAGSFAKIRFFVIQKISNDNDFEENAVITNIARKMFMEAKYLSRPESIIFNAKACHSNILNQISVGSVVRVKSSTTFNSSRYHWYGYDVTIDKYRKNNSGSNNVKKKDREILEENYRKTKIEDLKETTDKEVNLINMDEKEKCVEVALSEPKELNNDSYLPLNTAGDNFKMRYHLLGGCLLNAKPYQVPSILQSYRIPDEYIDDYEFGFEPSSRYYSPEVESNVRKAVKEHNLLKKDDYVKPKQDFRKEEIEETFVRKERIPKQRKEFKLEKVLEVLGTIHESKVLKETFVLPDTNWKPRERRVIGLYDDLQWILMGTFVLSKEEVEETIDEDEEEKENKPLLGGWWYRRTVPRDYPIRIVKSLKTCRNILEDCTVELKE